MSIPFSFNAGGKPPHPPRPPKERAPKSSGHPQGKGLGVFLPTAIVLGVILAALFVFAQFWTELQWYEQIRAERVFWTQYLAAIIVGLVGALVMGVVTWVNFRVTVRKVGVTYAEDPTANYRETISRRPWIVNLLVPAATALVFGANLGTDWRSFLLWFNGSSFGKTDPQFGKDVSFYVFSLPALQAIVSFLMTALIISVVAAIIGHYVYGGINFRNQKLHLEQRARIHFGVIAAVAAVLMAARFYLRRFETLLVNQAKFSGAGYSDVKATIPGLTILAIVCLLLAVLFVVASARGAWRLAVTGVVVGVVAMLVVTSAYPYLIQKFQVEPNAVELESKYIQRNINATLEAYGLENVEMTSYAARTEATRGQLRQDSDTAAQIRLLDPSIVSPAFNQLEQNRQYYSFANQLSVDRYEIDGKLRDTVIAVRELNIDGLDNERRSWVNDHTVYTHGFGVAAAYGNTSTVKGDPSFFERGIPSTGDIGDYEPRVYFGQRSPEYSIVGAPEGSEPWELDYPDDKAKNSQVNTTYKGDGGPRIKNVFDKLLYAIRFKSTELFFSDRVTSDSQILFRRNPSERVQTVAPFLTVDSRAYPAVVDMDGNPSTKKDLVWIIDAYTTSNNYPYSARQVLSEATADSLTRARTYGQNEINYIRNSVKAVVNAYDGSVTLYAWDQKDPILKAWEGIFPGLVKPLKDMPGDLIAHVRYPEDLFKVQRTLLARYHVRDAASFYSGGDFWQIPREPTAEVESTAQFQPPYYLTLKMPGQKEASFSLTSSYIPGGNTSRNIMTGFLAVDSNAGKEKGKIREGYGQLRLLELPRNLTVPGPGQAENAMVTDPKVTDELNPLRIQTSGTQVIMGNLLTLPVGGGLMYVQPVYLQASQGTRYPQMKYVITLFGDQVGFATTLDKSLDSVFGGDSGVQTADSDLADVKTGASGQTEPGEKPSSEPSPSASANGSEPTSASPSSEPTASPGQVAPGAAADLNAALQEARQAILDSEAARKAGDWAAYGEAQTRLQKAVERAIALEGGK